MRKIHLREYFRGSRQSKYVTIDWSVDETTVTLKVDGNVRYTAKGNYSGMGGDFNIGAADSTINVKSLTVTSGKSK